jgi:hypothetical protein
MRGEVVFEALGRSWTLRLGNAAQCAVEEQYNRGFFAVVADGMPGVDAQTAMAIAASMSDGVEMSPEIAAKAVTAMRGVRVSVLRDLAFFGLRRHHPEIVREVVSDIADDLGDEFGVVIGKAIRGAQNDGGSGDDAKKGNPPKPRKPAPRKRKQTG